MSKFRFKKNEGKYTSSEHARILILRKIANTNHRRTVLMSTMGYAAFPDYDFNRPQAAAFAVSRIVRKMRNDGLVTVSFTEGHYGYYITSKGKEYLQGNDNGNDDPESN